MPWKLQVGRAWRVIAVVALLMAWGTVPGGAQQQDQLRAVCAECHPGRSEVSRDLEGAHGREATCLSCHHAQIAGRPATAVCARCHDELTPTHQAIAEGAPGCSSCHTIHDDATPGAGEPTSAQCRACHDAPHALHAAAVEGPECTDCHTAHTAQPLRVADPALEARCAACHEGAHPSHPKTGDQAIRCTTCHSLAANAATLTGAQLAGTCADCHETTVAAHGHVAVSAGSDASRHAPQCPDCHSFAEDPPVAQAVNTVSRRCGACHEQELQQYLRGGHSRGLKEEGSDHPNCVTCHGEHSGLETRISATAQCVRCHSSKRLAEKYNLPENVGASYSDDFHGATVQLLLRNPETGEAAEVMVCADCHGAHEVGWNEAASLSAVCLRCHERGDERLSGAWLGHARVSLSHQPLIWLVRLFYYFTIPFVLLGLGLNILFHFRDQRRKGARMRHSEGWHRLRARLAGRKLPPAPVVTRFGISERLEHFGSMSTFILLLLTGLPQTRPDLRISNVIIGWFGGIGTTRVVHRTVGVMFVALLVLHVTRAVFAAITKHRLPVMTPTRQDFEATLATLRHFLQGTPRPKVGKFDFSEKFEYWGLFLGGTLMSVTGVILLYPELVTRALPGELVAMFRVMHGLEATFAVLVVVLWHTYGVILRPEVFPLDTSIFTGKMSVERLKEEHELEYERLFPAQAEVQPETRSDEEEPQREAVGQAK